MKLVEGIKVHIVFGHYESDNEDDLCWLQPDLTKDIVLIFTDNFNESKYSGVKKELINQVSKAFDTLVEDYKRRLEHERN